MKVAEAKSGKVRYAKSRVASGGTKIREGGGIQKLHRQEPDFLEYLSQKDRRRWNLLPESKKERILRKVQGSESWFQAETDVGNRWSRTTGRDPYRRQHEEKTGQYGTKTGLTDVQMKRATVQRFLQEEEILLSERDDRLPGGKAALSGTEAWRTDVREGRFGVREGQSAVRGGQPTGIAGMPGTNKVLPTGKAKQSGSGIVMSTGKTGQPEASANQPGGRLTRSGDPVMPLTEERLRREDAGLLREDARLAREDIRSPAGEVLLPEEAAVLRGRRAGIQNRKAGRRNRESGIPESSAVPGGRSGGRGRRSGLGERRAAVSARPGGIVGMSVSSARKAAKKISQKLRKREFGEPFGTDGAQKMSDIETPSQEVKKVTGPIKKIVGALLSLLALALGPILFVIILVIILLVVIVFFVAWMISLLIPVMAEAAGSRAGGIGGWGNMPYYCQQDDRWGSYPYDEGTIYYYGCGPTSMAMILACLTGDSSIDPTTIAELGNQNIGRYGLSVNGTHSAPVNIAALYGIEGIEQMAGPHQNCCGVSMAYSLSYLQEKIAQGCPILVSVTGTYMDVTTAGHYFVLYGQGENGVYIYDPATLGRIYQESQASGGSDWNSCLADAKHIWIFPAPEITISGDSNAEKIFGYLVQAGWSKAAAAAAVGNFYQEAGGGGTSDINPASYSSGGGATGGGIAGFTDNGNADSFTALKRYAQQKGKDWTDLQVQCEFLVHQMSSGTWWGAYNTPTYTDMVSQGYTVQHVSYEEFIRMTDVNEATKAFLCFYEDCGYRDAHYEDVRLPMAQQAYAAWG